MKRFAKVFLIITVSFLFIRTTSAGWFGPSNYDECITENMKGISGELAAKAIIQSCRNRFPRTPKKTPTTRQLSYDELNKLSGKADAATTWYYGGSNYSAAIYNGNTGLTVTKVDIWVSTRIDGIQNTRRYSTDVTILPLNTANAFFNIITGDPGAQYHWVIASAQGY